MMLSLKIGLPMIATIALTAWRRVRNPANRRDH